MNLSRLKPNDEMKLIEKKNFFFIGDNDVLETERKRFGIRDWKQHTMYRFISIPIKEIFKQTNSIYCKPF